MASAVLALGPPDEAASDAEWRLVGCTLATLVQVSSPPLRRRTPCCRSIQRSSSAVLAITRPAASSRRAAGEIVVQLDGVAPTVGGGATRLEREPAVEHVGDACHAIVDAARRRVHRLEQLCGGRGRLLEAPALTDGAAIAAI